MSVFRVAILLITLCVPLSAAQPPDKKPQMIKGWGEVTDPDGDCDVTDAMTITIPKTWHDLTYTDNYTKLNSPRILRPVKGDFTLQVKVLVFPLPRDAASSGGAHSFISSGLLVWQDEKNFVRLERAAVAGSDAPFAWFERFKNGKSIAHAIAPLMDKDTVLRIERRGKRFMFLYNDGGEGDSWTELHAEEVDLPAKLNVGVVAINTTVREFSARLTGLEVHAKK